jgi:tetratricopeptide (TPR) repeat protein
MFMRLAILLICCAVTLGQDAGTAPSQPGRKSQPEDHGLGVGARGKQYGAFDILSDTQGVDFGPYMKDVLVNIRENWYPLIPDSAATKKGKLAIEFAITKEGKVADMRLVARAEDETLNRAAWGGITASNPFKPLPEEFKGPYLALRMRFYYNPDKSDLDGSSTDLESGNFDAAIQKYQQILREKPDSSEAYASLTRIYLTKKDVAKANETIARAVQVADAPTVRVALGEVYFREGKISEAEREWTNVINSGHADARAYLGLFRIDKALSLYKKSKDRLDKAHQLDPSDPDIQRYWIDTLGLSERIKTLEEYLANIKSVDTKTRDSLQHYLQYLKARQQGPPRNCKLIGHVTSTQTNLVPLLSDPRHMRGLGLSVSVNGTKANLLLDTGASGILIDRGIAEKAGLTRLSETSIWGIGDKGSSAGWIGLANSIKIGELEFQNCPVEVMDKRSVAGENGLVGADVFDHFLVDISFPDRKLRLSELPKRPGETDQVIKLKTDKDDAGREQEANNETAPNSKSALPPTVGPFDAYVSPDMKSYSKIFRFGHQLLIPTRIGNVPAKLFLIDSGAFTTMIDPAVAREVTKVRGDDNTIVKGISGSVNNVFSADKAVLTFGHLKQENQDIVSFDMTPISDSAGTEIAGALGFTTLHWLNLKIDYRDGLVDLSYDANRSH